MCERACAVPVVSADGIVAYFKKQVGPASVVLADDEQLQTFLSDKDASIVGELPFLLTSHLS